MVGGKKDQFGAFFSGLPDGFSGLDAKKLGGLIFCQDDAVAAVRVSAYRHRQVTQLRMVQQLYRGVKAI